MNNVSVLLDKIEKRLGTKSMKLPEDLRKDKWMKEVIKPMSIMTFSRYFPHKMLYYIDCSKIKNGWFFVDEDIAESVGLLGVRDVAWHEFSASPPNLAYCNGAIGAAEFYASQYNMDDIALMQMSVDHVSMFNNNIFVDFEYPNKIKLSSTLGINIAQHMPTFPVHLLVMHPENLMTIAPTKMEIFEKLCIADVASYLFEELKMFDGLETVFTNIDLKLSYLETKAATRDEIVQKLEESYVSMANDNQPAMYTV